MESSQIKYGIVKHASGKFIKVAKIEGICYLMSEGRMEKIVRSINVPGTDILVSEGMASKAISSRENGGGGRRKIICSQCSKMFSTRSNGRHTCYKCVPKPAGYKPVRLPPNGTCAEGFQILAGVLTKEVTSVCG